MPHVCDSADYKNGFPDASAGKALETPKKKDVKEVVHDVSGKYLYLVLHLSLHILHM